ncbi:hypothetical protein [Celeribacter sp.]|uniref:hypothetical protein n=1 Tax=Celeribacter sp. TaxID=1890673 RepID=UPI003A948D7F
MTRHITDTATMAKRSSPRLARFAAIERQRKPSRATLALQKAPRGTPQDSRARAFTRIERGIEA